MVQYSKVQKEKLYHYLAEDGTPEAKNIETGEVSRESIPLTEVDNYVPALVNGRKAFVHKDTVVPTTKKIIQFNSLVAEEFCINILQGGKLIDACVAVGISYSTFCKWRRTNEEFAKMVEQAQRDRAEIIFERLLDVAQTTEAESDEISLGRLKADIYKYISAVSNERLNPKTRIEADHRVGIVALDTGIPNPGSAPTEEDQRLGQIVARNKGPVGEKEE